VTTRLLSKWLLIGIGSVAALVLGVFLAGAALPRDHVARVQARFAQPPERVFATIADVEAAPAWRGDLERVEILSAEGEPLRWRETGRFGDMTFVREEEVAGRRLVGRIADTSQGFGGRWIYELEPADGGTLLTITEEGEVYSPFFRFMARFVFGHNATMEAYVRSLAGHYGEEVVIERVDS
jgi:hypothetical protein